MRCVEVLFGPVGVPPLTSATTSMTSPESSSTLSSLTLLSFLMILDAADEVGVDDLLRIPDDDVADALASLGDDPSSKKDGEIPKF